MAGDLWEAAVNHPPRLGYESRVPNQPREPTYRARVRSETENEGKLGSRSKAVLSVSAILARALCPFLRCRLRRPALQAIERETSRAALRRCRLGCQNRGLAKASAHIEIEERLLPSQGESHTFESCQVRKCADEATSFLLSSSLVGDSSNRSRYIAKLDALFSYWWAT